MKKLSLALIAFAVFFSLTGGTAWAEPSWKRGGENRHERGRVEMRIDVDRDHSRIGHYFTQDRREAYRDYAQRRYRKHCPPGLAKKGKGCIPPGHSKYIVGERLSERYHSAPLEIVEMFGPPPHGSYYVMVDNDVLLISTATKKILDAVTLLSAVR